MSLHPHHLLDLKKSALSDDTILLAGIYSVTPSDISRRLENHFPKVESLLAFPYSGHDGFERFKLFPSQGDVKYYQKKGSPAHLYFPPQVKDIFSDTSKKIGIVEGEKKALAANQKNLPYIGIGGLWNWSDGSGDKNLISDFDLIQWEKRDVEICADNDFLEPSRHGEQKNLRQA
ncbi:MAG: DUF3854 domain-containing protein, partial [Pseudomonadota bacterium]